MRLAPWRAIVVCAFVFSMTALGLGPKAATARPTAAFSQVGLTIPNLAAYWDFDSSAAGIVPDLTANNNDGTLTGAAALDAVNKPAVPAGNVSSMSLGAVGDRLQVPDSASLSITGELTLSAWIRQTTAPDAAQRCIIEKWDGGVTNGYMLRLLASHDQTFGICPPGPGTVQAIQTTGRPVVPSDGTWHHVAGVFRPSPSPQMVEYRNGVLDALASDSAGFSIEPVTAPGDGTAVLHIGADYGANQFMGNIDEVRIYNRALTVEEVNVLITGQPPATALVLTPGAGSVNVAWTAPAAQAGVTVTYTVQRSADGGATWTTVQSNIPYGTTSINDPGVTNPQSYHYRVFAISVMESTALSGGPVTPLPGGTAAAGNTRDNEEGLWEDRCSCGSSIPGASGFAFWVAALAAILMLAVRRT